MAFRTSLSVRRLLASVVSIAALSGPLLAGAGVADGATPAGRSCSYDLGTKSLVCVNAGEDLNKAVLERQHVRVVVPSGARGVTVRSAAVPDGALTTYVQTQLFDDVDYGGSFFQITNSSGCTGGTWYFGPLGDVGWSGRVSSFKSFSSCSTKLWQGTDYSGSSYGYTTSATSLGTMNDRANSVTMR